MMKLALILLLAGKLSSAFDYRESDPSRLFPYRMAAGEDSPLGYMANPAGLPLLNMYYLQAAYGRPYGLGDLGAGCVRAGWGSGVFGCQAAWDRFGMPEYREDVFEGSLGGKPFPFLAAGLGVTYYRLAIRTEDLRFTSGTADGHASLLLFPLRWITLGFRQDNIASLFRKERRDLLYPESRAGVTVKPARGLSLSWDVGRVYYGYVNSLTAAVNLLPYLCLRGGYSRESSTLAASVTFLHRNIGVSYVFRHHAYLGATHALGVTLTSVPLSLEQVPYFRPLSLERPPSGPRIDINRCTLEELKEVPLVTEIIAERIIKYRSMIGPVTRSALFQIGMKEREIDLIEEYIHGLAPEPEVKRDDAAKRKDGFRRGGEPPALASLEQRNRLFRRLIESGVPASAALRVTELARRTGRGGLSAAVEGMTDITPETKKAILKACAELL